MSNMLQHLLVCTITYFRPTGEIRAVISTGGGVSSVMVTTNQSSAGSSLRCRYHCLRVENRTFKFPDEITRNHLLKCQRHLC